MISATLAVNLNLNLAFPAYELHELVTAHADQICDIAARYNLHDVCVFGAAVADRPDPFFDVNFLVRKGEGARIAAFDGEVSALLRGLRVNSTTEEALGSAAGLFRLAAARHREILRVARENPLALLSLKSSAVADLSDSGLAAAMESAEARGAALRLEALTARQLQAAGEIGRLAGAHEAALAPLLRAPEAAALAFAARHAAAAEGLLRALLPPSLPDEIAALILARLRPPGHLASRPLPAPQLPAPAPHAPTPSRAPSLLLPRPPSSL
eukprot:tig00001214_g7565.t1